MQLLCEDLAVPFNDWHAEHRALRVLWATVVDVSRGPLDYHVSSGAIASEYWDSTNAALQRVWERVMITCTVFNASYEPVAVVSAERGLILHLEGKAFILETLGQVDGIERRFRSPSQSFPVPTSVVLKEYRKTGSKYYKAAQLNQRNLFLRDDFICQYCLRHDASLKRGEYLTRDHVQPLSRGGRDEWTNCVTACSTCNHRKDDHTPEEAGLTLRRAPKAPTVFEVMQKRTKLKRRRAA